MVWPNIGSIHQAGKFELQCLPKLEPHAIWKRKIKVIHESRSVIVVFVTFWILLKIADILWPNNYKWRKNTK